MEKTQMFLVMIFVVLCLCVVYRFLYRPKKERKFVERAINEGSYTDGVLISNKLHLGNDDSGSANFKNDKMICVYQYNVNGVSYKKKITFQSPGMVSVKFPYTVKIYYDRKNPKKCVWKK